MYLREILFGRWPTAQIALLALMAVSSPLQAADVAVDCDGGDDLQTAIDAADDGDVLTISGTCLGTFFIDGSAADNLTLEGTPYATLDGDGASPVVTVDSRSVVLANLTIQGGVASGSFAVAGLSLFSSDVMLLGTIVTNNHAEGDFVAIGGISVDGTALTIIDSQVTGNIAVSESSTGAALAYGGINTFGGTLIVDGSIIQHNHASATSSTGDFTEAMGGIAHTTAGALTITNTRVTGNSAAAFAPPSGFGVADGGIGAIITGPVTINKSRVLNNDATASHLATGGTEFFRSDSVLFDKCTVRWNTADALQAAGGILLETDITGATTITKCKIRDNVASGTDVAGGILKDGDGSVSLEKTLVKKNLPNDCVGLVCD